MWRQESTPNFLTRDLRSLSSAGVHFLRGTKGLDHIKMKMSNIEAKARAARASMGTTRGLWPRPTTQRNMRATAAPQSMADVGDILMLSVAQGVAREARTFLRRGYP